VSLAVVIQELVFADAPVCSSLPTRSAVSRRDDDNFHLGLGEAIVSGTVTPDTLTVSKKEGKVLQRQISQKRVMTVRTSDGITQVPVPKRLIKKAVLNDGQASN